MILAQDETLAAPAAPAPRSALPDAATTFVAGEQVAALVELIRDAGKRLVTVTGAGGSGKTRLAIEVLRRLEADFDGRVRVAMLATTAGTA